MLMRCAAVGIGLPSVRPLTRKSVIAREAVLLQIQMVSTYSIWVQPTGDLASTAACVCMPRDDVALHCTSAMKTIQRICETQASWLISCSKKLITLLRLMAALPFLLTSLLLEG